MFNTLEDVAKARQKAAKQAEDAMVKSIPDGELVAVIASAVEDADTKSGYAWELEPLVLELISRFNNVRGTKA